MQRFKTISTAAAAAAGHTTDAAAAGHTTDAELHMQLHLQPTNQSQGSLTRALVLGWTSRHLHTI